MAFTARLNPCPSFMEFFRKLFSRALNDLDTEGFSPWGVSFLLGQSFSAASYQTSFLRKRGSGKKRGGAYSAFSAQFL